MYHISDVAISPIYISAFRYPKCSKDIYGSSGALFLICTVGYNPRCGSVGNMSVQRRSSRSQNPRQRFNHRDRRHPSIQARWVVIQISEIIIEATRLTLVQRVLSSVEFKMDPQVSLYNFAPVCAAMNAAVAFVVEVSTIAVAEVCKLLRIRDNLCHHWQRWVPVSRTPAKLGAVEVGESNLCKANQSPEVTL